MVSNRIDLSDALWKKSSHSNGDGGECVEVADGLPGIVPVRDSKVRGDGPVLLLTARSWAPFVAALKDAGPID
ncbi:hypothetical protein SAM23877_4765 [Streptomyces ambofaciens ATCC 23877]|uniref:DUF397 domain-containing protein n=2 Tax=Streptomyces ambofaciens TaxID=1889 RepID=A0A0K2AXE5_STRA7|nr:DUF397 domain-containing protein [Streptomyces ambofaciens]AKZ57810.1 hypothetical protein SAM23877_4765 [Streptomyces ambofaciens ATCC 23877]ANB08242.1 toxin [Streptomyces ambofaciens]